MDTMELRHHVRILAAKRPEVRRAILDELITRAFNADEPHMRTGLMEYNAKLFTALREEKVWPLK